MALANSYPQMNHAPDAASLATSAKPKPGVTAHQYQRAQVETASPTQLVILLYEGAIRFCQLALNAMAVKDLHAQHVNLIKAQRIVAELLGSLNREQGGEVAENLARLYGHMLEQLVAANLQDEAATVRSVQAMLRELWASWVEVERQAFEGSGGRSQESGARGGVGINESGSQEAASNSPASRRLGDCNA